MGVKLLPFGGLCLFILLLILPGDAQAELRLSQRFHSPALDAPLAYSIYLPPEALGVLDTTFPVVYLLHGVGDNERSYPKAGDIEATMDRLVAAGEIVPMIVVMPAAKRSWYVDNAGRGGAGNYETAIMRDLIGHVGRTYPAESRAAGRFITGHSMGGFGALRLAFKFPDKFGAVAAMSAALWDRVDSGFELPEDKQAIFAGAFGEPFDPKRFMAAHPRAHLPALQGCGCAPPVYLTSGDDDYFRAYIGTFRFFTELREAGLTTELRITDGGHAWKLWRETALPNVLRWFSGQYRRTSAERTRDDVETEGEQGAE